MMSYFLTFCLIKSSFQTMLNTGTDLYFTITSCISTLPHAINDNYTHGCLVQSSYTISPTHFIQCLPMLFHLNSIHQTKLPAHSLRQQDKASLTKQLEDLKEELASLRVQKVAGKERGKLTKM